MCLYIDREKLKNGTAVYIKILFEKNVCSFFHGDYYSGFVEITIIIAGCTAGWKNERCVLTVHVE